jgi:hypothetical protein
MRVFEERQNGLKPSKSLETRWVFVEIFVAEKIDDKPLIDLLGGPLGLFQSKIDPKVLCLGKGLGERPVYLVPHDAKAWAKNSEYLNYLNYLGRDSLIIFSDRGDYPRHPKIRNSVALRVALQPHESRSNKVVLPYNVESLDFLPMRQFSTLPKISFMGLVPINTTGRKMKTLKSAPFSPLRGNGAATRKKYLKSLRLTSLDLSEVTRTKYGALGAIDGSHLNRRAEFLQSLEESDIVVAPRGDSNQSMRFFETLSSGRVPLFPDTEMELPSLKEPFPERFLIRTDFTKKSIELAVSDFWGSLDESSYFDLQKEIRAFFSLNLDFNSFASNLFRLSQHDFTNLAKIDHC